MYEWATWIGFVFSLAGFVVVLLLAVIELRRHTVHDQQEPSRVLQDSDERR